MTMEFKHGSHIHPVTMYRSLDALQATVQLTRYTCGLCAAQLGQTTIYHCSTCGFTLCKKCFDVDERPFPQPQIVVRNPQLDPNDQNACMRTRPRASAHKLNLLYPDVMMEVVAFAESKEDQAMYFRQAQGGWILASDVVCVYPSQTSMAPLVSVRMQYGVHGSADLLPQDQLSQLMEDAMQLMQSNPSYGAIMMYYLLLPVQLQMTNTPVPEDLLGQAGKLCMLAIEHGLDTMDAGAPRFLHRTNIRQHFAVRLVVRAVSVLWHIVESVLWEETGALGSLMVRVQQELATLLSKADASACPRRGFRDVMQEQWDPSPVNQPGDSADVDTYAFAFAGLEASQSVLLLANDGWTARTDVCAFDRVRSLVSAYPNHTYNIADELLNVGTYMLEFAKDSEVRAEMQQGIVDMDIIELIIKNLNKHSNDERVMENTCSLIEKLMKNNAQLAGMLPNLLLPPLCKCLRNTKDNGSSRNMMNAMASILEAYDSPVEGECGQAPDMKRCSAFESSGAVYQDVVICRQKNQTVALCQYCASGSCGLCTDPFEVVDRRPMLSRCQCPHCSAQTAAVPLRQVPAKHPNAVQQLLISERIASLIVTKVRVGSILPVDAACRLALCLTSPSEELALEVLMALRNENDERLSCGFLHHALLLLGASRNFTLLKRQLKNSSFCDAPITAYITGKLRV